MTVIAHIPCNYGHSPALEQIVRLPRVFGVSPPSEALPKFAADCGSELVETEGDCGDGGVALAAKNGGEDGSALVEKQPVA